MSAEGTDAGRPAFDFAISFAGEDRAVAKRLWSVLDAHGAIVFFADDLRCRAMLLGEYQREEYARIYGPGACFVVPLISEHYCRKDWPRYEFSIARQEQEHRGQSVILPIRLDDSRLPSLRDDIRYIDLRKQTVDEAAEELLEKPRQRFGPPPEPPPTRWVAAFGVSMAGEEWVLPPGAPADYPKLCDWLAEDALRRARIAGLANASVVGDLRNGETFSVRIAFDWDPVDGPLDFGQLDWWDLLEVLAYEQVYG